MNNEQRQLQNKNNWNSINRFFQATLPHLMNDEMGTYERNGIINSNLNWALTMTGLYANPGNELEEKILQRLYKMIYALKALKNGNPLGGM